MTLARRRQLAGELLQLADVRPGEPLRWYQHKRVMVQLRTLAAHAHRLGLLPGTLATAEGRDALAALMALPPLALQGRIDAEWDLLIALAQDALRGQGLPAAALAVSADDLP